jgi:cellulose synthase/poly-beta-1,6-N-acetylglucosamine synthase-like glycosyltransferase
MDIDHPDLRVWVLDDGARDWVRTMAEDLGALYLCRVNGKRATSTTAFNNI